MQRKQRDCATAPAGLFQDVAWFVASSLVLVPVLVGCLLWLWLNALAWVGWLVGWLVEKVFCRRGFTLKCDFVAGAGVGDEVQISWCGGGWGAQRPPPAADHSHVKQVHVECKENKETAPAGLFQHVAWFVASSLVLVHVLVGCLLWLLLNALVVIVVAVGLC